MPESALENHELVIQEMKIYLPKLTYNRNLLKSLKWKEKKLDTAATFANGRLVTNFNMNSIPVQPNNKHWKDTGK